MDLLERMLGEQEAAKSQKLEKRFDEIYEIDTIEEVEKFNPYHDRLGRFTSAGNASSFTIRTKDPGKQRWADRAIARDRIKYNVSEKVKQMEEDDRNRIRAKLQNQTIAGVKRGESMTHDQANHGKANPNFNKGGGYHTNCQSCVATYEARLRGYDVITKPNTKGSKLEELSHASYKAWIDPATGTVPVRPQSNPKVTTPKKCRAMLEETIEEGKRYTFSHSWKGRVKSGHIICADRDTDGKVRLFDPQSGKVYKDKDLDNYLERIKYTMTFQRRKYNCSPRILRVDNLELNPEFANEIMEVANHG